MAHTMYADFSEGAFDAFQNGNAVDNNGFRSKKGNFYPDQPTFRPVDDNEDNGLSGECMSQLLVAVLAVGVPFACEVVIPFCKRITEEKLYPFVSEKLDELKEKRQNKKALKEKVEAVAENNTEDVLTVEEYTNIIDFEDLRMRA